MWSERTCPVTRQPGIRYRECEALAIESCASTHQHVFVGIVYELPQNRGTQIMKTFCSKVIYKCWNNLFLMFLGLSQRCGEMFIWLHRVMMIQSKRWVLAVVMAMRLQALLSQGLFQIVCPILCKKHYRNRMSRLQIQHNKQKTLADYNILVT